MQSLQLFRSHVAFELGAFFLVWMEGFFPLPVHYRMGNFMNISSYNQLTFRILLWYVLETTTDSKQSCLSVFQLLIHSLDSHYSSETSRHCLSIQAINQSTYVITSLSYPCFTFEYVSAHRFEVFIILTMPHTPH